MPLVVPDRMSQNLAVPSNEPLATVGRSPCRQQMDPSCPTNDRTLDNLCKSHLRNKRRMNRYAHDSVTIGFFLHFEPFVIRSCDQPFFVFVQMHAVDLKSVAKLDKIKPEEILFERPKNHTQPVCPVNVKLHFVEKPSHLRKYRQYETLHFQYKHGMNRITVLLCRHRNQTQQSCQRF